MRRSCGKSLYQEETAVRSTERVSGSNPRRREPLTKQTHLRAAEGVWNAHDGLLVVVAHPSRKGVLLEAPLPKAGGRSAWHGPRMRLSHPPLWAKWSVAPGEPGSVRASQ